MGEPTGRWFALKQIGIAAGAIVAYFGVRGLTAGDVATAERNAEALVTVERSLGVDVELGLQTVFAGSAVLATLVNWVYIWLHWPVIIGSLWWLLRRSLRDYLWLRDAMLISGSIGLVIFALLPVAPPRLFDATYVDTVTVRSVSYRVLQPPMFVNLYAAVPSLHFGWNLLVGIVWFARASNRVGRAIGVLMPLSMGLAVIATGNHWVLDVVIGGIVALLGGAVGRHRMRRRMRDQSGVVTPTTTKSPSPDTRVPLVDEVGT
ncbi:MAG: hypothetical protein RLZZ01_1746 [Actinomycetota bacterium]